LGWLDRSIDPLDGLEIGRANVLHGATAEYVDPRLRPETRQVKAMAAGRRRQAVRARGNPPAHDSATAVRHEAPRGGLGGQRLGEQNALRAIHVFFDHGYTSMSTAPGSPGAAMQGFRGPVKNHTVHEVPLLRSPRHDELLPRVRELLGLPASENATKGFR
jgi:hypothetical protein